jgi:hypothetical protein
MPDKDLPVIPDLDFELSELDFMIDPEPPAPVVGVDLRLDNLTKLALAGQTHTAAQLAVTFEVQHQLLTYAMHKRNAAKDPITRKYLDYLIRSLMQIAHQALHENAATAVKQTRALLVPAPANQPGFSWRKFWLDPTYLESEEYQQAVKKKSLWRRLWEDS